MFLQAGRYRKVTRRLTDSSIESERVLFVTKVLFHCKIVNVEILNTPRGLESDAPHPQIIRHCS